MNKNPNRNIVLTGLRGSGKTSIGELLSLKLSWKFIDLDEEIEKLEKMKIREIVELRGWEYFRARENEICKKIGAMKEVVIATGGGAIIDPENEKALKKNGKIIYLFVTPESAAARILHDKNRPPLTSQENTLEELKQLYRERNHRYCESANIVFKRSNNLAKDTEKILKLLEPK